MLHNSTFNDAPFGASKGYNEVRAKGGAKGGAKWVSMFFSLSPFK